MDRRVFLSCVASSFALPGLAHAYAAQTYSPSVWTSARDAGGVVVLNFRASWSLTCQMKADILTALTAENPAYARLIFIEVDWDTFGPSNMAQKLRVTRNSTLVVTKGGKEIARLEAEPYERKIRKLLDQAVAAG